MKFPDAISEGFLSSFYCRWNAFKILPSGFGRTSAGRRAGVGRRFSERRFIDINSFFTHLLIHAPTQPPTLPPILLLTHSRTHSFNPYRINHTPIQSFSNSLFEPSTRSSNQSINHLLILTINHFFHQSTNQLLIYSITYLTNYLTN